MWVRFVIICLGGCELTAGLVGHCPACLSVVDGNGLCMILIIFGFTIALMRDINNGGLNYYLIIGKSITGAEQFGGLRKAGPQRNKLRDIFLLLHCEHFHEFFLRIRIGESRTPP